VAPRVVGSNPIAHPNIPFSRLDFPFSGPASFLFPVRESGTTGNRSPKDARSNATAASSSDSLEVWVYASAVALTLR
jgi:hypothetical protein